MDEITTQIHQVWKVEQEILNVIDSVCKEYGLRYSLAYGTLIGAVRHGGFIPWDDDIDIVMPRQDYEKLLSMWDRVAPRGYLLQNTRGDDDFTQNFTKIRKDHTTFLQYEWEKQRKYHKGVFVDIFPGDRVASGKLAQRLQYIACAVNLLYSRGFTSGASGVVGVAERLLINLPHRWHAGLRRWSEGFISQWNGNETAMWFFPSTIDAARKYYSPNLFEEMTKIEFCNRQYSCCTEYDSFLRVDYGDYMQLPPEEDRVWAHHPILVDFKHNYEELI